MRTGGKPLSVIGNIGRAWKGDEKIRRNQVRETIRVRDEEKSSAGNRRSVGMSWEGRIVVGIWPGGIVVV